MSGRGGEHAPPVYPFREDSALLLPYANLGQGWVLEVFCGEGRAALASARAGGRTVASDLNPEALRQVARAARMERLRVGLVRTDLFRGLGRFDRILANPPYLPTRAEERDPDPWVNLALDGGEDGLRVTERLVREAPEHLRPGGRLFVVTSSVQAMDRWAGLLAGIRERGVRADRGDGRQLGEERLEVWEIGPWE